jgi:hypothetical protein
MVLLVLGAAVAGWGCALLSGAESDAHYQELQRESDAKFEDLMRQFDTLDAEQQQPPYVGTLQQLYDFLTKAEELSGSGTRSSAPLIQRHEKLANWGYGYSQLWLGRKLDPCRSFEYRRQLYLDYAGRARAWYEKAAAQNQPGAAEALAHLDTCKVPEQ